MNDINATIGLYNLPHVDNLLKKINQTSDKSIGIGFTTSQEKQIETSYMLHVSGNVKIYGDLDMSGNKIVANEIWTNNLIITNVMTENIERRIKITSDTNSLTVSGDILLKGNMKIVSEKKDESGTLLLDNDKITKLLNEKKNSPEAMSNFDDLISLCLKHKEMQLKYDLEKNVSLVKFSNGQIECSFNENIDKNFIKNLSKKLFVWTGKRWIITLSKEKGQPTHQEIKLEKKQTQLDEAIKTNVYKKMIEVFSDAKLITVEENEEKE